MVVKNTTDKRPYLLKGGRGPGLLEAIPVPAPEAVDAPSSPSRLSDGLSGKDMIIT